MRIISNCAYDEGRVAALIMQTQVKGLWLSYAEVTKRTGEQIERCMADAHRRTGLPALIRREWAYGAYMGWRALMADMGDQATYMRDDRRLEAMLNQKEPLPDPSLIAPRLK